MSGRLNLNSGCRGNAGLDGRIQILFSRHEYSSPQGRLSYNNKPLIDLLFLDKFKQGWLSEFQSKIIWIMLPYFADKGKDNGWYADAFIRMYLSKMGLKLISNQKDDDLFLLLDADELPLPEILLFLKLYDGYTEPIRFGFR